MASKLKDIPNVIHKEAPAIQDAEKEQIKPGTKDIIAGNGKISTEGKDGLEEENEAEEDNYYQVQSKLVNEDKTTTIIRSPGKKPGLQGSLVGLREGVPGTYSGFECVAKKGNKAKAEKSVPDSKANMSQTGVTNDSKITPKRPPRRNRNKSGSDKGLSQGEYDVLWQHAREQQKSKLKKSQEGSVYSVLNMGQEPAIYDTVEDDDGGPVTAPNLIENGQVASYLDNSYNRSANTPTRPQSNSVVLPSEAGEGFESDSDSWATDFDDSASLTEDFDDSTIYEIIGEQTAAPTRAPMPKNDYDDLGAIRKKMGYLDDIAPPLPPRSSSELSLSDIEDPDRMTYVAFNFQCKDNPPPVLPPLPPGSSDIEAKRHQIIKCMLENERKYMATLHKVFQEYELPVKEKGIIGKDRIKVIFHFIHEIEQCHQLFNMALCGRMNDWVTNPNIGDIIYASFSKSTVLKAYSNFARNFTRAMESVKETCRLVPAFLHFLKNRLYKSQRRQTLYDLLKAPLERLPHFIVFVQELLKITPFPHQDHMSLQMALTELECLSETVSEKRRDVGTRHKVQQLDKYLYGLKKGLASRNRYYIRHDDMLHCVCTNGQVASTKLRRLFMLSDLLICAKLLNRTKQLATLGTKRYKVKWCVPLLDVEIVELGSGISVNVDNKTTTTISYTHPVTASPRPGSQKSQEKIESLQHDLTIIGEIAGLVASLRGNYEMLNQEKVNEWYRNVRLTCDHETEKANMNWLELSLPIRDGKTTCLFNLSTARRKLEWSAELDNAKLRLSHKNNPGWYLPDEEGISSGGSAVLRRTLPLLSCAVPLFMVEQKYSIECVLEVTHPYPAKPILWVFSGNEHAGQITLMEMSMSSVPHVVESFCACNSRISTAEVVRVTDGEFNDPYKDQISIWCGTVSGMVEVFDGSIYGEHKRIATTRLKDSVVCLRHANSRVFAGLANGTLACFRQKMDASWDLQNPTLVMIGQQAILSLKMALGRLWCSCGNSIVVLDVETLAMETTIKVSDETKLGIKHIESYGVGVWVTTWKSAKLELFHAETFECVQTINVAMPVGRMKNDIDSDIQNILTDKIYITSLLAHDGVLWVGTDVGVILTYPLPRLGGVPQVSGRPCVAFHGHNGPVRCLRSFRVTRNLHQREMDNDSQVARSLFYSNPYDDASDKETDLDNIGNRETIGTTSSCIAQQKQRTNITNMSGEPIYFTIEPEENAGATQSDCHDRYHNWVSSFGNPPNPAVGAKYRESKRKAATGYDSDESIDSDTDFCFIEDSNMLSKTGQVDKNILPFSVNVTESCCNKTGPMKGVVIRKGADALPAVKENEFIETMNQFNGFKDEDGQCPERKDFKKFVSSTPENEPSKVTGSKTFPLDVKTQNLGQESPGLYRVNISDDLTYEQPVDNNIGEDVEPITFPPNININPDVARYYRYAPLPPPPTEKKQSLKNSGECNGARDDPSTAVTTLKPEETEIGLVMDEVIASTVVEDHIDTVDQSAADKLMPSNLEENPSGLISPREEDQLEKSYASPCSSTPVADVKVLQGDISNDKEGGSWTNDGRNSTPATIDDQTPVVSKHAITLSLPVTPVDTAQSLEADDMVYTPLLPEKQGMKAMESTTLSGTGLDAYDREYALSSSLLRDSPEGGYTTLLTASRGSETKRELLLQPWYVVTVGPGHVDFRKKSPRPSAKDFFKSFRSSNPDPQILIWKITAG